MTPTDAELAVLHRLAVRGATTKSVAHDLGISPSAARRRLASLYRRLGVDNALQAYAHVTSSQLVPSRARTHDAQVEAAPSQPRA